MNYPLISKWLPDLKINGSHPIDPIIYAADLERELGNGWLLRGVRNTDGEFGFETDLARQVSENDTHQGLLIGIQPIKKEQTADELLAELVENINSLGAQQVYEKCRAYLARKK